MNTLAASPLGVALGEETIEFFPFLGGPIKPLIDAFVVDERQFFDIPHFFQAQGNEFGRKPFLQAFNDIERQIQG